MAYTPTLADVQELHSAPINTTSGYTPTLADIPSDNAPSAQPANTSSGFSLPAMMDAYGKYQLNTVLGAGDAIHNTLADVANLVPGVHLPMARNGSGVGYDVGQLAGNTGAFLGGGEILDGLRAAAEGAPVIGKVAQYLGGDGLAGVLRRGTGAATYGYVTNPDDREKGAIEGALLSGATDALPLVPKGISKVATYFNPNQAMDGILNNLGAGQSLEDNAKSIAQDVKNAYTNQVNAGKAKFQPVFDSIGNNSLYGGGVNELSNNVSGELSNPNSLGLSNASLNGGYPSLSDQLSKYLDPDLTDLHQAFLANPTFQNAHTLQSQLGSSIRDYYKRQASTGLDVADKTALSTLQRGKNALTSDINSFLQNQGGDALTNEYQSAKDNWRENVAPYQENLNIRRMAMGKITNPRNIANVFQSPEPAIQKVVDDLPDDAKNRIVYSLLGKSTASRNPENLINNFEKLSDRGLSSYITPSLADQMQQLKNVVSRRNYLERAAGIGAGAGLGHALGIAPGITEIAGAGAGALFGPQVIGKLANLPFMPPLMKGISTAAKTTYSPLSKTLLANLIPQGAQ